MTGKSLCVLLALFGGMAAASAQTSGTKEEQAACRPDVRKFCGHLGKADDQKYRECLQAHISDLSQKCQQVLMSHRS